jgi:hypothetical protein
VPLKSTYTYIFSWLLFLRSYTLIRGGGTIIIFRVYSAFPQAVLAKQPMPTSCRIAEVAICEAYLHPRASPGTATNRAQTRQDASIGRWR